MRKVFLVFFYLIPSFTMAASDVLNTNPENTSSENTIINTTHISIANDWGLTNTEWNQYLRLMQGPSGHYYKQLSPPEVLGISADSQEDLEHYAEIAAKLEHDRLTRELKFNAAFHEAAEKNYGSEPIIKPFDFSIFKPFSIN
jgi:integrating conjugative element protein (TIGR03759 family)